jgi:NADH-quinone oxidoreductase subunit L
MLALPLLAFVVQLGVGKKLPRHGDWLAILLTVASCGLAISLLADGISNGPAQWSVGASWPWLRFGTDSEPLSLTMSLHLDTASAVLATMVTLISLMVNIFSIGYMRDENSKASCGAHRYAVYFGYLGLFTASMLGVVIAGGLIPFFVGWELMGFCSYQLIGFYRDRESATRASLKAFLVTRAGDVGLLLGLISIFHVTHSLTFLDLAKNAQAGAFGGRLLGFPTISLTAAFLFMGTLGKSAQFPLQVWLPDAMEGPTPVSALIHAATMVAAGVLLLLRVFPLLELSGLLPAIAYFGAITAFLAAVLALCQSDIKKVLAYSTVSQLGLMVLAIGVSAPGAAFAHLLTHAFFKAGLFLGAGAAIVAAHHEQDLRKMGGLKARAPVAFWTLLVFALAISGFPLLSGAYSKELILGATLEFSYFQRPIHLALAVMAYSASLLTPITCFD